MRKAEKKLRRTAAVIVAALVGLGLIVLLSILAFQPRWVGPVVEMAVPLLSGIGVLLLGLLAGIALGKDKIPKMLAKPSTLRILGVAVLLLLGFSGYAVWRADHPRQEVELARQASSKDAADQLVNVMWEQDDDWRMQLRRATTDDEALALMQRVVAAEPLAPDELTAVYTHLARYGITPTLVITQPLILLQDIRDSRAYRVRGVPATHTASLALTGPYDLSTLEVYDIPDDIEIRNGKEHVVQAGWAIFVVHPAPTCPGCDVLLRPHYVVSAVAYAR